MSRIHEAPVPDAGALPEMAAGIESAVEGSATDGATSNATSNAAGNESANGTTCAASDGAQPLTHLDARGQVHMVEVGGKNVTVRRASARGFLRCRPATIAMLHDDSIPKGDALATARIAGITGAKLTPRLVPLAHPIALSGASVELEITEEGIEIAATVSARDCTGVEMEALTAVSVAALALVDMLKGVDRELTIENLRVTAKSGGRSGDWARE